MELPDAAIEGILARWPVADLASIGPDGRPHLVPVVFVHQGGVLWSAIDGKPKSGRELARVRNLRRNPHATLLIHHYDEDWTLLWWLRIEGEAEVRSLADAAGAEETAAVAALREKYPQYAAVPILGPEPTLLRIAIGARRSWCASIRAANPLDRRIRSVPPGRSEG